VRHPSNRSGFIALAALAVTVGAGAAILFAPEEGSKTRKRVGRGFESLREEAAGKMNYVQRELRHRRRKSRREQQLAGLVGLVIGAGVMSVLMTESGSATRKKLGGALNRIKVGAVDRIDRLRQGSRGSSEELTGNEQPIPTVQELGRDPNSVF
jgi:microcompartment protein CcmK/EutM